MEYKPYTPSNNPLPNSSFLPYVHVDPCINPYLYCHSLTPPPRPHTVHTCNTVIPNKTMHTKQMRPMMTGLGSIRGACLCHHKRVQI